MFRAVQVSLGERSYDILIGNGAVRAAAEYVVSRKTGGVVVVSDEIVWAAQGKVLIDVLDRAEVDYSTYLIKPGEHSKSLSVLEQICEAFAQFDLRRDGLVIAFGGGVVGDLAGFAASVWMRGCDYIQISTTLLSQIDSGVGGKTAVNLKTGKNLVGSFYQPQFVVADTGFLDTLPEREWRSGLAEMIKYGALFSEELFLKLAVPVNKPDWVDKPVYTDEYIPVHDVARADNPSMPTTEPESKQLELAEMIETCCKFKRDIVQEDELDGGKRRLLNFGHSFGHAIEQLGGFTKYNHGEAVAIGMLLAAALGEWSGFTQAGCMLKLREVLSTQQLPVDCPYKANELLPVIEKDKKFRDGGIDLVLLREIGQAEVQWYSMEELKSQLSGALIYLRNGGIDEAVIGIIITEDE